MPLIHIIRISKDAYNEMNAYLTRLLNCPSIIPVDPATNTDGIVIPRLSATDSKIWA